MAEKLNLSSFDILNENPLYRRRRRRNFSDDLAADDKTEELSKEDILKMNRIQHRFSRAEIEAFLEEHMEKGVLESRSLHIEREEDFEKLILAYDLAMRKNSRFEVLTEPENITDGRYSYPSMTFVRKRKENEC